MKDNCGLCVHIIIGGKLGFSAIKTPFAEDAGTAAAVIIFALGVLATVAIRVTGPPLPRISGVGAPTSIWAIVKQRWKSILIYSWLVNGSITFMAGLMAATALPTVGALINGLPTELWASLNVLSESRSGLNGGVGGAALQLLDSAPIYASLSTVTLFLFKDTSLPLWACALIGFVASSVVAVVAWRIQLLDTTKAAADVSEEGEPLLSGAAVELRKITHEHHRT